MLCYRWWRLAWPSDDHYCELPAGHDGPHTCACGAHIDGTSDGR